jgi:CHASE3 domain sensor protein
VKAMVALVAGYLLGAKTGQKELERLNKSLRNLYGTTEFQEVVNAARAQVGASLRELAATVEGQQHGGEEAGDLVDKVRRLVAPDRR